MTETVSNAVAKNEGSALVVAQSYSERFAAVLPDHIDTKGFLGLAAGALYRDPKLMQAANNSPAAFMNALMRCATLGHQPGTEEFYLTPRKNKANRNLPEIQGIEGYRGIVERMYRSGAVASVIVREVCANDKFQFVEGVHDRPVHEVDWFGTGRGDMVGVYAYAVLTTGAVSRVVILNKADVMAAKAKSEGSSSDYSPWKTSERSMWWKTAARRLEPWVPTSAEYRREQLRAVAEAQIAQTDIRTERGHVDVATGEIHDAELVDEPAVVNASAQTRESGGES
jgi:recombination protein RecT